MPFQIMSFIFLLTLYIQVCFPLEVQFETEDNQAYKVEIPDESKDDKEFEIAIPNKYKSYPTTIANRMLFDDNIRKERPNKDPYAIVHSHGIYHSGMYVNSLCETCRFSMIPLLLQFNAQFVNVAVLQS